MIERSDAMECIAALKRDRSMLIERAKRMPIEIEFGPHRFVFVDAATFDSELERIEAIYA